MMIQEKVGYINTTNYFRRIPHRIVNGFLIRNDGTYIQDSFCETYSSYASFGDMRKAVKKELKKIFLSQ
jgi:hypothetical protein